MLMEIYVKEDNKKMIFVWKIIRTTPLRELK